MDKNSTILSRPDSPSIPVIDYRDNMNDAKEQWNRVFSEYWWARGKPDHVTYESENAVDFQTTFGALPNHHCILDALDLRFPKIAYDDSLVNREKDPGAGAFSYNMGREWFVKKDLKAGDEIFLNYGYCEHSENADDWTAHIPMPRDYQKAADITWAFLKSTDNSSVVDERVTVPKATEALVASLLPESLSHLRTILSSSERRMLTKAEDLIPLLAKHIVNTPRTPEWIRSNGMCLEHLMPGKSQLPQAGQGGFAQHRIQKGEIVVPAPMLQITDEDALIMYDDDGNVRGSQLLLNYCFGHSESSILLCPVTNAGLVNHCSKRTMECGPDGPNAEVRWSTGWDPASDEWRNMTMDEIAKKSGRGLSMEIVALRDIKPGEEVFIDYGVEWEEAWEEHVDDWEPPGQEDEVFVTAKEANEQEGPLELLVTGDLRRKVIDHPHLFTGCRYWTTRLDRYRIWNKRNLGWVNWDDEDILDKFADDGSQYQGDYSSHGDETYWPCTVIRQEENETYTVRIHQANFAEETKWHKNNLPRFLTNYPRQSIHYFVHPYESDQHLPGAFRHPIGIRDDIFPEQWKNRKHER